MKLIREYKAKKLLKRAKELDLDIIENGKYRQPSTNKADKEYSEQLKKRANDLLNFNGSKNPVE